MEPQFDSRLPSASPETAIALYCGSGSPMRSRDSGGGLASCSIDSLYGGHLSP